LRWRSSGTNTGARRRAAFRRAAPQAGDALEQRTAPGADQPGEADDLAGLKRERHAAHVRDRDVAQLEDVVATIQRGTACRAPTVRCAKVAPDHRAHQVILSDICRRVRGDAPSVAQHGDAIGEPEHLVEPVADVDDGGAALRQGAHGGEQMRRLRRAEHGGGLVEQQDVEPAAQGARQLHLLALTGGEIAEAGAGRGVAANRRQGRGRSGPHVRGAQQAQRPAQLLAEEDPRRGIEIGGQRRVLRDPGHARTGGG
jgi:hypothetical protein